MSDGFGHGPCGQGPCGHADYSRRVTWLSVPQSFRELDTSGVFEKFLEGVGKVLDDFKVRAMDLAEMRDARTLRTRYNGQVSLPFIPPWVAGTKDGQSFWTATFLTTDSGLLTEVFPGWAMEATNRPYVVKAVSKVGGTLEVWGEDAPVIASKVAVLRPPPLLHLLGQDLGTEVDGHEPEALQRSTVYDVVKWYDEKGTEKGFELRALIAGFTADVKPIYRIDDIWVPLLGSDAFELPVGSGQWYTTTDPTMYLFDEIAADFVPTDTLCTDAHAGWGVTVNTVTDLGEVAGQTGVHSWVLGLDPGDSIDMIGSVGHFRVDEDATTSTYWVEAYDAATPTLTVQAKVAPGTGAYKLKHVCHVTMTCDWCKSYKVIAEAVATNPDLLASPLALDDAFTRLLKKVKLSLPAHVVLAQTTLITTSEAAVEIDAESVPEVWTFDLYDVVAADVQTTDVYTVSSERACRHRLSRTTASPRSSASSRARWGTWTWPRSSSVKAGGRTWAEARCRRRQIRRCPTWMSWRTRVATR